MYSRVSLVLQSLMTSTTGLQGLIVQLKQEDDEISQLDALGQLNELLSISNEESLSLFPLDQLIPTLVSATPFMPTSAAFASTALALMHMPGWLMI